MKKLFLSFIFLMGTAAIAMAQTSSAKAYIHKPNVSPNSTTSPAKSTDWVAYKQQIILDHQKKLQLNAASAQAAKTKKVQTVN